MDAEEIAALAAGLGRAMAEGLAANDVAREEREELRERAWQDEHEARETAQRLHTAMRSVREQVAGDERRMRDAVAKQVACYCAAAKSEALEALKHDARMPRGINYLQRYNALQGVQERGEVLRLIGVTLDAAERAVRNAGGVDAQAALADAAAGCAARVAQLDGIEVGKPGPGGGAGEGGICEACGAAGGGEAGEAGQARLVGQSLDADDVIDQAFRACMAEQTALEAQALQELADSDARAQAVTAMIEAAAADAGSSVAALHRERARQVAGQALELGALPAFDGQVHATLTRDPAQLLELVGLVRVSFKTFSEVVGDNGLFAAFCQESSYGACLGHVAYWWDDDPDVAYYDGAVPGEEDCDDIPTGVEEDEGGDTLGRACERMRAFNRQRYWGMLDDDFSQHVSAFWYGFKKLMENVNALFEVDMRSFDVYCDVLCAQAKSAADVLACQMDHAQVSAFCDKIRGLERRLR